MDNFEALIHGLQAYGATCRIINKTDLVETSFEGKSHLLSQYTLPIVPQIYGKILDNEPNFKAILQYYKIPYVLPYRVFNPTEMNKALSYAKNEIRFPVVCKHAYGMNSYLVFVAIHNERDFVNIWQEHYASLSSDESIIVEKYLTDAVDYRFFCFKEHEAIIFRKYDPGVFGDGKHSVQQLVFQENTLRIGPDALAPLILDDTEAISALQNQSLTPNSVPKKGQFVRLRYGVHFNYGSWMEKIDIQSVHPDYWHLIQRVWNIFPKMPFFSVDILSNRDLNQPPHPSHTVLGEVAIGPSGFADKKIKADSRLLEIFSELLFGAKKKN